MWLQRGVSVVAITGLLCSCAPGSMSTQSQRIGSDDGTDSCRIQLVALDSTGNFFGADILQGAAVGAGAGALAGGLIGGLATGNWRGAAIGAVAGGVTGGVIGASNAYWSALQQQRMDQASLYSRVSLDLEHENTQIDKTQLAFNALVDCRYRQAQAINADYRMHRIDRASAEAAMALVRQRAAKDLALARMINQQIQDRGQQFGVAAGNIDPSAQAAFTAAPAAMPSQPALVRTAASIKLRPDPGAPDVAQLRPNEHVTVSSGRNGYALVQTASGQQGYVSASDLQGSGGRRGISVPNSTPVATSGDMRTLAGSNAARRDDFAQSVSVTEKQEASGFELSTS
jgi:outer membrane lipoprotein SlyB